MKTITSFVSTLAILGGFFTLNSVNASIKIDKEIEKAEKVLKQAYTDEFEIPVIGEIKKQGVTDFEWPNLAGEKQKFYRIKTRVNEEERISDVTVNSALGKDSLWYYNVGATDSQLMRKKGDLISSSRFLVGDKGTWESAMKPIEIEMFWKRQTINLDAIPTLLKLDFSNVTWEKETLVEKKDTTFSGNDVTFDPNAIDLSKLKLSMTNSNNNDDSDKDLNSAKKAKKTSKSEISNNNNDDDSSDNEPLKSEKNSKKSSKSKSFQKNDSDEDDEDSSPRKRTSKTKEKS